MKMIGHNATWSLCGYAGGGGGTLRRDDGLRDAGGRPLVRLLPSRRSRRLPPGKSCPPPPAPAFIGDGSGQGRGRVRGVVAWTEVLRPVAVGRQFELHLTTGLRLQGRALVGWPGMPIAEHWHKVDVYVYKTRTRPRPLWGGLVTGLWYAGR